ncbi:MAG TPA: biopolymer transporter ExbD, partial [Bacteroidetes bacterium]|nr:biopolymer transporter ExbD [Bacteroidota bacterium]
MEFRTNRKLMVTFSAISLTDIVLLLLIFFLLSSSYIVQPGIKVRLPKAVSGQAAQEKQIVLTITRDQEIFLNGR